MPNVVLFPLRLKLNSLAGSDRPTFRSKTLECRAGIQPSAFQLDTADTRTPASAAAALFPPTKLTMSPTVRLMQCIKFKKAEKSIVQISEIDNSQPLKFSGVGDDEMTDRDELMARVRQLPEILGKRDGELSELCRVTPQQWSNYKAEGANNIEFPWRCALILWQAYGVPMEWLYDGETSRASDPVLRERLTIANQKARAWLEARRPKRPRGGGIARIGLLVVAGALLFAGCANTAGLYKRIDGAPIGNDAIMAAKLSCEGEMNKANLSAGQEANINMFGYSGAEQAVFRGCMADKGYLPEQK